jgi:hypothetical protein
MKTIRYLTILVIFFTGCFDCRKYYLETVKGQSILGRIEKKFENENNHNAPLIELKSRDNLKTYDLFDLFDLYTHCEVGDSLLKESNSLEYVLIKKDTVLYFSPKCHGEIIQ